MRVRHIYSKLLTALLLSLSLLTGCDRMAASKNLPNPVQSKDGMSYIPIDDTAFLIPDKTWLKGYGRNSTDGMVSNITLHATVPDVQPLSQARHEEMYWPAGPGKMLLINIEGNKADVHLHFHEVPHSRMWRSEFIEEPSDQAAQGLRRFRQSWGAYTEEDAKEGLKKYGSEAVEHRRRNANKPMMDTVYYEYVKNNSVKYLIRCNDDKEALFELCHLSFPWARSLMIDIGFARRDIDHIVAMTDKVSERLREFEASGLAYRVTQSVSLQSVNK
jgi:hypothetical protein